MRRTILPTRRKLKAGALAVTAVVALAVGGCVLEPGGAAAERDRLAAAGSAWQQPFERRELPPLAAQPTWQDVLERAFLANGELEAAWHEWAAAVEAVRQASAYPNTNVMLGAGYMFSRERMKAWDRTTLSVGFDPSMMLQWPGKTAQAGRVALEEARVARLRLETMKFALQREVLTAYVDYALQAERVRIQQANVELLAALTAAAAHRARTGGPQAQLLAIQSELDLARNDLQTALAGLEAMRAMLNGMLSRPADAPLAAPPAMPAPRPLDVGDDLLIAVGVDRNPELAALAGEVAGRREALKLARMAYIPDFSLQVSVTGNVSQAIGLMVSAPTTLVQIRSSIRQGRSMLLAGEAMSRQAAAERASAFVTALVLVRDYERQSALLNEAVVPRSVQALAGMQRAYSTGSASYADMIDAQRTLLEARLLAAETAAAREKRLAELEALAGLDVETLIDHAANAGDAADTSAAAEDDLP